MAINQKVISSNLNAGDISLKAGGNLALVSSNLNANNINLNADENVIVDANHNVEASQSFTKSSRFSLKPTSLYESSLHLLEKGDKKAVAANLNANENININANNISLKGANLNSQKDINLNADLIDISNTNDESYRNEVSKKSKIGLISIGEHIKNLKADLIQKLNPIKDLKAKTKDTSIKVPVAKASLDQKSSKENWVNANSSNLNANGDINLNAKDDINIVGSNLNANEAINLTSQNSNIKHSTNLYAKDTSSKEATGTLSITAQNEYAQIAPAALALKEAIAQLKRVKKEYDNYKKERSKLEASLSDIKQRYKSKEVGIDYSDIEEVSEILEEYRDEEKYFKENILLATENVNAKNLALITQIAAALASSGTYGFSVGVRADLATTKQESSLKQTSSNKSSLNAKHININSTKDISITGSDLASKEDMSLNSNNLNINSSEDSLKYKSNTRSLTTGFGFTFYGANSSSLELGTNSLKQSEQSLINNNSHLYSAKDMNINTANDATIKGANLRADERLNLKVGNNLSLESTRDIKDASSKSKGINLSVSYSGATNAKNFASGDRSLSSVGASISKSSSNTKIKQTNLSSITANELNVEVGKNTHLKGSLLASGNYDENNKFIDNHNLNLKTNTLSYENLSNTSYNKGSSLSIGANYSVGKKDEANKNSQDKSATNGYSGLKSINYSNHRNLSYTLSKNLATLGSGNIEIADKDNSDDLTRLNRDTTKLTKDLVNTSISSNVDGSIDARVLTKSGQKEIVKEVKQIKDGAIRVIFNMVYKDEIREAKQNLGKIAKKLETLRETDVVKYNEVVSALNEYARAREEQSKNGEQNFAPLIAIPVALAWFATYLNSPDKDDELKNGIPTESQAVAAVVGGGAANLAAKGLSKTVLKETATTSVKTGTIGAGVDGTIQVVTEVKDKAMQNVNFKDQSFLEIGSTMIDNINNIKFSDFTLDYNSLLYSGIATATTVPSMINSAKAVKYDAGAIIKQFGDMKTVKTQNRRDKLFDNIRDNFLDMGSHIIFQGANYSIRHSIKNEVVGEK